MIVSTSEARLDRYDELVAAAWQGALWGRIKPDKFPKLEKVLARRRPQPGPDGSLNATIATWDRWFAAGKRREKADKKKAN